MQVLETVRVLGLGLFLHQGLFGPVNRFAVRSILNLPVLSLLSLFGVVVFLEVLLRHLPLDYHKAGVDERLLKKLALKHPHQIFDSDVFSRGTFYDSAISLYLLLYHQSLLRVLLSLLLQSCLVLLEQLC